MIGDLEPICGICFAVSLAYMALPKFRYRDQIKDLALSKLEKSLDESRADIAENKHAPRAYHGTVWYKKVLALANPEAESSKSVRLAANGSHGLWALLYDYVFGKEVDRALISIGGFLSAFVVFLGVAEEMKLAFADGLSSQMGSAVAYAFWTLTAFAALPIAAIKAGGVTVGDAKQFIHQSVDDYTHAKQGEIPSTVDTLRIADKTERSQPTE